MTKKFMLLIVMAVAVLSIILIAVWGTLPESQNQSPVTSLSFQNYEINSEGDKIINVLGEVTSDDPYYILQYIYLPNNADIDVIVTSSFDNVTVLVDSIKQEVLVNFSTLDSIGQNVSIRIIDQKTFTLVALISLTFLLGCDNKQVTVSFEENGGNAINDITVIQKNLLDEPLAIREGYTFEGWYEDVELSTSFDFNQEIIRNITLYANWEINAYSLTFLANNNTDDIVVSGNYNTTITFPTNPEKVGYEFGGWYLDDEGNSEFTSTRIPSEDSILTAHWIQNQYTVNFFLDSSQSPVYTEEVLHGEAVANSPAIPVVTGMNGSWDKSTSNVTSDLNVYVEYSKKVFTITFKDFEENSYSTLTLEYGDSVTPPTTPSRLGYDFIGYYSPEQEINIDFSTYTVTEDLVLVDAFQIQSFNVMFFGGEEGTLIGSVQYIDYGNSAIAPTEGYDRDGYTFTNWDIAFDSVTGDLNVSAVYTINQYDAVFDANGGVYSDTSETLSITQDYNSNVAVPEVPTKAGFIFVGWYLDLDYSNEVYFGTGIPMSIDGFTVYAKWQELAATTYTVSGTYYFEQVGIATDGLSTDGIYTQTSSESYTPFINILYDTSMSPVREIEGYVFDKFVVDPTPYCNKIAEFLGTEITSSTEMILERERCPRVLNPDDRKQMKQVIEQLSSERYLRILNKLTKEYEACDWDSFESIKQIQL